MSSGSPSRRVGIERARSSPKLSTSICAKSVFTRPGAMPTTRTFGPSSPPELAGEVDERGLGEVVDAEQPLGPQPADRRDVDDDAAVLLHPPSPRRLRPEDRALHVDLERLVVAALVDLHDRARVGIGRRRCSRGCRGGRTARSSRRRTARPPRRRRRSPRTRGCRRRSSWTRPRRAGRASATRASPSLPTRRSSSRSRSRCPSTRR